MLVCRPFRCRVSADGGHDNRWLASWPIPALSAQKWTTGAQLPFLLTGDLLCFLLCLSLSRGCQGERFYTVAFFLISILPATSVTHVTSFFPDTGRAITFEQRRATCTGFIDIASSARQNAGAAAVSWGSRSAIPTTDNDFHRRGTIAAEAHAGELDKRYTWVTRNFLMHEGDEDSGLLAGPRCW